MSDTTSGKEAPLPAPPGGEAMETAPLPSAAAEVETQAMVKDSSDPPSKPADPASKPADPALKPADPIPKPADPAPKPADPIPKPADPASKPADPIPKPADPAPKPADLAPKHADPAPKPADPAPKPAAPASISSDPAPTAPLEPEEVEVSSLLEVVPQPEAKKEVAKEGKPPLLVTSTLPGVKVKHAEQGK